MKKNDLTSLFEKNYKHWLEYTLFYSRKFNLQNEAYDILNEVLLMVWKGKSIEALTEMMKKKKKNATELDYFILHIIQKNIFSRSAPYRHKYHHNRELEYRASFPPDSFVYEPKDTKEEQLDLINYILEHLDIKPLKIEVFKFYYFEGKPLKAWEGPEALKTLYKMKNEVVDEIKIHIKKIL